MQQSPAMYARRHSHELLKRAASDPRIVPAPCAATRAARPEALVPSTSRASSTSPMFVTPANKHRGGRAGQQQPHLGATADRAQPDGRSVHSEVCGKRTPLRRSRRGPTVVSSTAETAKVTALAPSSAAGATRASNPTPIAGPAVRPRSSSAPNRPSAAGRRSPRARRVTPESAAGENSALPKPAKAAPTTIHGSVWANATSVKATMRRRSAAIAHVRQPTRSTSAPSSGPNRIAGSRSGISTAVIAHAECVCSYAISGIATCARPEPRHDCACAAKNRRLGESASAARSMAQAPAGTGVRQRRGTRRERQTPCSSTSTPSTIVMSPTL